MPDLPVLRMAALAVSACLLAPESFAQTSGAGGPTPPAQLLRPEIRTGKVISTLPDTRGAEVEPMSAEREDPLKKRAHVGCVGIEVSVNDAFRFWNGTEYVGGYRQLSLSCTQVYDPPPGLSGAYTLRRGGEVFFNYVFSQADAASLSLAQMYLAMAQDAMRLDRTLRIDYVPCDDRFGPAACWNQIVGLTLYNDRRTNAY
jgi:hypothetical protein